MQLIIVSSVSVIGDGLVGKQQVAVITSSMFQLKIRILVLFQKCFTPKNCFSVGYKCVLTCFWSVYFFTASAPWFEAFRDCFFQLVKPSDHEFIRHFLACILEANFIFICV